MDFNSRAFTEAVKALNDVGLLDPQKLAVTPVSSLKDIAELAIDGWEHQISKEQMLTWLKLERNISRLVEFQTIRLVEWVLFGVLL